MCRTLNPLVLYLSSMEYSYFSFLFFFLLILIRDRVSPHSPGCPYIHGDPLALCLASKQIFWRDRRILYRLDWPKTHYVAQPDLESDHSDPSASAFQLQMTDVSH